MSSSLTVDIPDVSHFREKLDLDRTDFSLYFGVSLNDVKRWEQHLDLPPLPFRVLMRLIMSSPDSVLRVIKNTLKCSEVNDFEGRLQEILILAMHDIQIYEK